MPQPEFKSNGRFYCYIRVSTIEQKIKGLSLTAQRNQCVERGLSLGLQPGPYHSGHGKFEEILAAGCFWDAGQSAYKKLFTQRPAASTMLSLLDAGDTLIVSRMDRAFRNVVDFITTTNEMTRRGIRFISCHPQIDLGTATGRALAQLLAVLAEWESARKGERVKAALAEKKKLAKAVEAVEPALRVVSLPSHYRPEPPTPKSLPVEKPGRIFIYIRCSHQDSVTSGLGLLAQIDLSRHFTNGMIEAHPHLVMGEIFTDAGVSAWKMAFRQRPMGGQLSRLLLPGDHIVFAALDRGFRSISDMALNINDWTKRGIHVHFVGEGFSLDDPMGRAMATIIVAFAEMEAELVSARHREAKAQLAAKGHFFGGSEPSFWRIYRINGTRRLVIDKKRILAQKLVEFLRYHGMTLNAALERCEELIAKREKRIAVPMSGTWQYSKMNRMLPKGYPLDDLGRAWPYLTRHSYDNQKRLLPKAMEAWRKIAAERKALEGQRVSRPERKKLPRTKTGWEQDGTRSFRGKKMPIEEARLYLKKEESEYESESAGPD